MKKHAGAESMQHKKFKEKEKKCSREDGEGDRNERKFEERRVTKKETNDGRFPSSSFASVSIKF